MSEVAYRFCSVALEERGSTPESPKAVTGTLVRYGDTANLLGFRERMMPGSLRFSDVIANLMHVRARPIARTGAGLVLTDSPQSLEVRISPVDTRDGREAVELVRAGVLKGMSAEFRVDRNGERESPDGVREITSAELVGLALVDRPAYPDSLAQVARRYAPGPVRRWYL